MASSENFNFWERLRLQKNTVYQWISQVLKEVDFMVYEPKFYKTAFSSLANLKSSFSKRQLKFLLIVLAKCYNEDSSFSKPKSIDRHEILANKLWRLTSTMGFNLPAVCVTDKHTSFHKKQKKGKKRKAPSAKSNMENARKYLEGQKRKLMIARLEEMGSSKDIATQAVLACGYEDVDACVNYIFDRFSSDPIFDSGASSSSSGQNLGKSSVRGINNVGCSGGGRDGNVDRVTSQEELDRIIDVYEKKGYPKSDFIVALRQANGIIASAVELLEKQKEDEARQIAVSIVIFVLTGMSPKPTF